MSESWLPSAHRVRAYASGSDQARVSRVVWLASDLDESYSAVLTARYLNATYSPVHIVYDPIDGSIVQMLSASTTAPYKGIPKESREGTIAVMVTGKPDPPFTAQPCKGLGDLMAWLRDLGIPDSFPLGPPTLQPQAVGRQAGHYGRAGAFDAGRLFRS